MKLASTYCSLIEPHNTHSNEDFITRIREILPVLYHHALQLPDMDTTDEEVGREVSHDEWSGMFASLQHKLGINDRYWAVFNPLKSDCDDPVIGSLSDDLADIWRDLKTGVSHWSDCSDAMRHQIVWDWHFSFHSHWSNHLVGALHAINWITECYGIREPDNGA